LAALGKPRYKVVDSKEDHLVYEVFLTGKNFSKIYPMKAEKQTGSKLEIKNIK
jgi:hypothetical protein